VETLHRRPRNFPHSPPYGGSIGLDLDTGIFRYVQGLNMVTGKVDTFYYGPDRYLEEHIFVPKSKTSQHPKGAGWLIGQHHNFAAGNLTFSRL
jgi:carotenoid cleavage dioxygenase-like enzyme